MSARVLIDREAARIRLTDERLTHILGHAELRGLEGLIEKTITDPDLVVQSRSDPEARLYYSGPAMTPVGEKLVCVVVKFRSGDAFVLTAYLTDRTKQGEVLWRRE